MTSIASMVRSRAPTRYFAQSGIVGSGDGGDSGSDDDSDDNEGGVGSGSGSVVKALTALQAL